MTVEFVIGYSDIATVNRILVPGLDPCWVALLLGTECGSAEERRIMLGFIQAHTCADLGTPRKNSVPQELWEGVEILAGAYPEASPAKVLSISIDRSAA